jgi:chromosome partitioning protein
MHTIALVGQKGGSGKTTLAASLAVAAVQAGENVVALDLDPQGSLAAWGTDRVEDSPLAVDALTGEKLNQISEILKKLEANGFTVAILDCPGVASTAITTAMKCADLCLVPARPTKIDLRASIPTVQSLVSLKRSFAFVLNQCPTTARGSRANEAAAGLKMLGALAEPVITLRADYQDALAAGQGVTEYAPHGKAAEEAKALWAWVSRTLKGLKKDD